MTAALIRYIYLRPIDGGDEMIDFPDEHGSRIAVEDEVSVSRRIEHALDEVRLPQPISTSAPLPQDLTVGIEERRLDIFW